MGTLFLPSFYKPSYSSAKRSMMSLGYFQPTYKKLCLRNFSQSVSIWPYSGALIKKEASRIAPLMRLSERMRKKNIVEVD